MTATSISSSAISAVSDYAHSLGGQAKAASALMASASTARKNKALLRLAALLRQNTAALQTDNAKDLDRARAAGLAAPMVDRLKLTPAVLETCAQGCEQLAAMADVIGEIIGMKQSPAASAWARCACPLACLA